MRYESKIFGKVDWPWWHDVLICGGAILGMTGLLHWLGG